MFSECTIPSQQSKQQGFQEVVCLGEERSLLAVTALLLDLETRFLDRTRTRS